MTGSTILTPKQIEIIEQVQEAAKTIGSTPTLPMLNANPDWPSVGLIRHHFKNYTELLNLAGLPAPRCAKRWNTKEIMELLDDYILTLGRIPTQYEVKRNPDLPSDQVYLNLYSDWESVIMALGYSMNWCSTWMKKKLTDDLWQKYIELGYELPVPRVIQIDPRMEKLHVYVQVFGDLRYSWIAAGIWEDYCKRRRNEIIETVLNLYKTTGQVPKLHDPGMPNEHLIRKVCGCSYAGLLISLGLKPGYRQYTKKQLTSQLQQKSRELGRSPTVQEINNDPRMASMKTFRKFFGSYAKALKAAKLPPAQGGHGYYYTKPELISQLQIKYKELGKAPTRREVNLDPSMASDNVFVRAFGSFKEALVAAEIPMRPAPVKYTDEELIAQLKMKAAELGRSPMQKEVGSDPRIASANSFSCRFGSFNSALKAAGLPLNRVVNRNMV